MILNNITYGIISFGVQGSIESANKAVEQMFGYASGELLGININVLMPSKVIDQCEGYISDWCKIGRMNGLDDTREFEGKRKDGSVFPLELTVAETTQNKGVMYTGILVDITQRIQADELAHIQNMEATGMLVGSVAHDINNMLTAIISSTYLVLHKLPENSYVQRKVEDIQKAADRATGFTKKLSDFSIQYLTCEKGNMPPKEDLGS